MNIFGSYIFTILTNIFKELDLIFSLSIMKKIISRNPFTKAINKQYTEISKDEVHKMILRASQAYKIQQKRTIKDKVTILETLANNLEKNNDKLANLISIETGKPIKQSKGQVALV